MQTTVWGGLVCNHEAKATSCHPFPTSGLPPPTANSVVADSEAPEMPILPPRGASRVSRGRSTTCRFAGTPAAAFGWLKVLGLLGALGCLALARHHLRLSLSFQHNIIVPREAARVAALDSGSSMYRRYGGILVDFPASHGVRHRFSCFSKLSAISWDRAHHTLNWRPLKELRSAASRGTTRLLGVAVAETIERHG